MSKTKAELEAQIAELQQRQAHHLAVIDAISESRNVTGVRVVGEVDGSGSNWSVCVIGRDVQPERGAQIAAFFFETLRITHGLVEKDADAVASAEGGPGWAGQATTRSAAKLSEALTAMTANANRSMHALSLVDAASDHMDGCQECQDYDACEVGINLWGDAMTAVRDARARPFD